MNEELSNGDAYMELRQENKRLEAEIAALRFELLQADHKLEELVGLIQKLRHTSE